MKIRTTIVATLMLAVLVLPNFVSAQTVEQLQTQIQSLLAQVQILKAQLAELQGNGEAWCHTFTGNLQVGMSGDEVSALQSALQKDGENVSVTGTFDDQTASAVSGFQEKYSADILTPNNLTYGTGYAGSATRAKLNALFGCGNTSTTTPPTSITTETTTSTAATTPVACPSWGCGTPSWLSSTTVPATPTPVPVMTNTTQAQIQALLAQLNAVQSQPSTEQTQAIISALLAQIAAIQNQVPTNSGAGTTGTYASPQPATPVTTGTTVPANGGNSGAKFPFSGYTWTPIRVSYGSFASYGNWFVDPSTNFLRQSEVTALHYKAVAAAMAPATDVDVAATVSMEQGTEMGVCARMDTAGNGYCFATSWGGGTYPQVGKFSGGDQNPAGIASAASSFPIAQNTDYVVKLRVQGSSIFGKVYPAGAAEPDWMVKTTDSSFANGFVGLYSYGSRPVIKSLTVTPIASTISVGGATGGTIPSGNPAITSLSSTSGPVGTMVTIYGSGFSMGPYNSIEFDGAGQGGLEVPGNFTSPDGSTLTFAVPQQTIGDCVMGGCLRPAVNAGSYLVSVTVGSSAYSNRVPFTVTGRPGVPVVSSTTPAPVPPVVVSTTQFMATTSPASGSSSSGSSGGGVSTSSQAAYILGEMQTLLHELMNSL